MTSTMMTETNEALHLSLAAGAESIGRARTAVANLAAGLGMEEPRLGDLKTLVSEACTNAVLHAYPNGGGQFGLDAHPDGSALTAVVRDFGGGLRPRIEPEGPTLRLGLGRADLGPRGPIRGLRSPRGRHRGADRHVAALNLDAVGEFQPEVALSEPPAATRATRGHGATTARRAFGASDR
jgi:anti-sigma regulatory factor (Ser/Thr protein kinase)